MKTEHEKDKFTLPDGWIRDSSVLGQMTFTYIGEYHVELLNQGPFRLSNGTELSWEKLEEDK